MTVCITKACKVRHDAAVLELVPGDYLNVPPGKEAKLIETSHARPVVAADYSDLAADFKQRDPKGGCWDWIIQHLPQVWRRFIQAMLTNNILTCRTTFNEMVVAWQAAQGETL